MECNKDEAVRAKEIAEQKLVKKDVAGAQKFALKAQNLFPGLAGLSQFLEVINVYVASERKINGESDLYGILAADPSADDETVRKHYRKLALALHPDKNKSVGADGAFKILSEAWSLLSDRAKRTRYDQKRAMMNVSVGNPPMQGNKNRSHKVPMNPASARNSTTANFKPSPLAPRPSKPETFWTCCSLCMTQFEYLKVYLNRTLVCTSCHKPFWARDIGGPPVKEHASSSVRPSFYAANGSSASGAKLPTVPNTGTPGYPGFGSKVGENIRQEFFKPRGANGASPYVPIVMQDTPYGQATGLKRPREEASINAVNQEALLKKNNVSKKTQADRLTKKRHIDGQKSNSERKGIVNDLTAKGGSGSQGNTHANAKAGVLRAERDAGMGSNKPRIFRESIQSEIRNMLVAKAREEIHKKLKEWSTAATCRTSYKEDSEKEKKKHTAAAHAAQGFVEDDPRREKTVNGAFMNSSRSSIPTAAVDLDPEDTEINSISVPDSDFHNFDEDRTEKSFGDNQVWAAYDEDDGMPRYYALIHNVISRKPFKVRISWLNSKSNSEFGPINWVGSGFLKTAGDFWIGKHEISKTLNSFSHMVKWTKGARGVIQIFPRKGDVWALYRNWSPEWNELTPDDVIHKYDMVEVLGDYSENEGVLVAPLVKAAGFKSVFHQHYTRIIPREEMFRFSHQVPSYKLTGQEAQNATKGFQELDPAAMPLELLQVMTQAEIEADRITANSSKLGRPDGESKGKEKLNGIGNTNASTCEATRRDSESVVREPILTYSRKTKAKKVEGNTSDTNGDASFADVERSGL